MPSTSPYRIELSDEEFVVLESMARSYTSPYWQVTRARMGLVGAGGVRHDPNAAGAGGGGVAVAAALPAEKGVPLSRWSADELSREAVTRGICEQISGVTVWRWLAQDAIKPWQHRSWIFPRDPLFAERPGPIPHPYPGSW